MERWCLALAVVMLVTSCAVSGEGDSTPASETSTSDTVTLPSVPAAASEREDDRFEMVDMQIAGRDVSDPLVLAAMRSVPRHRFVPEDLQSLAYRDRALPIGHGQTISQPYVVALMTEALDVEPGDRVLEIGTGSGYQAAVLAQMGVDVYSIEIIPELAERAASVLAGVGYDVEVRTGDGYFGWEEAAPFEAIIVTAAPDHVPSPLVDQLVPGGRLVVPVGPIGAVQTLWRFTKVEDDDLAAESLGQVMFVPFTRGDRW